jgi:membrane protein DedA with SNARE-associated domain
MSALLALLQNFSSFLRSGQITQLGDWIYLLLALLVAIQGPTAILLAAAGASAGWLNPVLVFVTAAASDLIADMLWYTLGYAGKSEWIFRVGRRLGIQGETLERLEQAMYEHAGKIVFMAKLTISLVVPTLIAAGLIKVRWRRWFPAVICGEMICTGSLVLVGYFAAEAIKRVEQSVGYFILGLSLIFILFMLWMGRRLLRKRLGGDGTGQGFSR